MTQNEAPDRVIIQGDIGLGYSIGFENINGEYTQSRFPRTVYVRSDIAEAQTNAYANQRVGDVALFIRTLLKVGDENYTDGQVIDEISLYINNVPEGCK